MGAEGEVQNAGAVPVAKDVGPWDPKVLVTEKLWTQKWFIALLVCLFQGLHFLCYGQLHFTGFILVCMAMNDAVSRGTAPDKPSAATKRKIFSMLSGLMLGWSFFLGFWGYLGFIVFSALTCFGFDSRMGGKGKTLYIAGVTLLIVRLGTQIIINFIAPIHALMAYAIGWVGALGPFLVVFIVLLIGLLCWFLTGPWWICCLGAWVSTYYCCFDLVFMFWFWNIICGAPFLLFAFVVTIVTTFLLFGWFALIFLLVTALFFSIEMTIAMKAINGVVCLEKGVQTNIAGGCGPGSTDLVPIPAMTEGGSGDVESAEPARLSAGLDLGTVPVPSLLAMVTPGQLAAAEEAEALIR